MKSLTNSYSTQFPTHYRSSLQSPIEICCTFSRPVNLSSTIITQAHQFALNARINQLLNEYELLKDNWDEDDAKAPSKKSIFHARFLTDLFNKHGQQIYHAAPGPNGEVMLDLRNKDKNKSVEFIFYKDKAVYVSISPKGHKQDFFDDEKLPEIMNWLNCEVNE